MGQIRKRVSIGTILVGSAIIVGAVVALVVTDGNAVVVGSLLLGAAAAITGFVLERIDRSRHEDGERHPEDYWGYRGRPGA